MPGEQCTATIMDMVMKNIQRAGYDPIAQIQGYLQTGNVQYVTRVGSARDLIQSLEKSEVAEYVRRLTEGLHQEDENGWRDKTLTR